MVVAVASNRYSLDGHKATPRLDVADLTTLQVHIAELRLTTEGTWLYVLEVICGHTRWKLVKRYSEIREFWVQLCGLLADNHSCTERCHFLAGFEHDKFPKKHLLHTKNVLEGRANDLDNFFLKLVMRLNLCKHVELERCYLKGCSLLLLLTAFFEIGMNRTTKTDDNNNNSRPKNSPKKKLVSYQSVPLLKNIYHHGKGDRRYSFAEIREVYVVDPQK